MITNKLDKPLVSIIITTKNSGRTIWKCLNSIAAQAYKNIEIIIVDNYSDDMTIPIINAPCFLKNKIKLYQCGPERSAQRNYGIKRAKGKYILYLDSDQYIHNETVKECVLFANYGFTMLAIPEINVPDNLLNRAINYEKEFTSYKRYKALPRFMLKEIFDKVGGFNEHRTFDEDIEMTIRIKYCGERLITKPLLHDEGTSLWKLLKKYYYYGGLSRLGQITCAEYDDKIKEYYGLDGRFFLNCLIFFLKKPILFLVAIAIKTLKYASFGLGMWLRGGEYYK